MDQILIQLLIFAVSLIALLKASDFFVEAAEKIGLSMGIPPFIIGVTIIAFGTSLPELMSSIQAVLLDDSKIVIGNVVGSNIANIALVLGIVAVLGKQIKLNEHIMNIDIPILVTSAFFLWFIVRDQDVSIIEAIFLLLALIVFLFYSLSNDSEEETEKIKIGWQAYAILLVTGIVIKFSAEYTVKSISALSELWGIGSDVIAVSLVALGTSLPEVFVSLAAVKKGKTDLAVGNVLGSNIFNTYAVVGIPALFGTLEIPQSTLDLSMPFMIALTLIFSIMCISKKMSRWEGFMLLLFYVFFMIELFKNVGQ
jgi:cation:H+ antiporter